MNNVWLSVLVMCLSALTIGMLSTVLTGGAWLPVVATVVMLTVTQVAGFVSALVYWVKDLRTNV